MSYICGLDFISSALRGAYEICIYVIQQTMISYDVLKESVFNLVIYIILWHMHAIDDN